MILTYYAGFGVTAGAHRLWTHKSYEAKTPLKIFLSIGHTLSFQHSIYQWSYWHRVHHKYSDTDADPHNVLRGLMFSHFICFFKRTHPLIYVKCKEINLSDLQNDKIVKVQRKYYILQAVIIGAIIPYLIITTVFDESVLNSLILIFFRIGLTLNTTFCVNSAAHAIGQRPYNSKIQPTENSLVSLMAMGEGYHK